MALDARDNRKSLDPNCPPFGASSMDSFMKYDEGNLSEQTPREELSRDAHRAAA